MKKTTDISTETFARTGPFDWSLAQPTMHTGEETVIARNDEGWLD